MPSGKLSEICKSERLRNQPKRKPFSDLTNGLAPAFGSFPSSIPDVTSTKPPASVISNAAKNKKVQNLWPTSTLRGIPSDLDLVKDQTCSTPHAQQRPTEKDYKGKSLAVASSSDCTQLGRTSSMSMQVICNSISNRTALYKVENTQNVYLKIYAASYICLKNVTLNMNNISWFPSILVCLVMESWMKGNHYIIHDYPMFTLLSLCCFWCGYSGKKIKGFILHD
ncbi:uncharacterized protein LOC120262821 isoform X1 [Dioscorea cayenensis subsp. rotundata]|uniref:Uncharacterized protein LOC120262821 isoform X1 n=1 Tax=Dioscorea cayennensis subsp. rotundata TaxID=55577 RepID=A0AB40BH63_DIOCR|nr:uncharacterized protein LOC120262821 isoform X1 [Dioscorea cayenensis subsp. rotundata]